VHGTSGNIAAAGAQFVVLDFSDTNSEGGIEDAYKQETGDGMALYCGTCCVIEFISFEGNEDNGGIFAATDGPAAGLYSVNVGRDVIETEALFATSHQRTGIIPRSFSWATIPSPTWTAGKVATQGAINTGQSVAPVNAPRTIHLYRTIRQPEATD
jgi:hypothetical protein